MSSASLATLPSCSRSPSMRHSNSSSAVSDPGIPITERAYTHTPRNGVTTPCKSTLNQYIIAGPCGYLKLFVIIIIINTFFLGGGSVMSSAVGGGFALPRQTS